MNTPEPLLPHGELLRLKRWNTPTIYNRWEQITRHNSGTDAFNPEEARDFMPQMGPMVEDAAAQAFGQNAEAKFGRRGEW